MELDGSVRIVWFADGFDAIRVRTARRPPAELAAFASAVADEALLNRTFGDLVAALRRRFPGACDVVAVRQPRPGDEPHVLVRLHPPRGEPNPDPGDSSD